MINDDCVVALEHTFIFHYYPCIYQEEFSPHNFPSLSTPYHHNNLSSYQNPIFYNTAQTMRTKENKCLK